MKTHGFGPTWIALALLVTAGGIVGAITAARHVRRYTTALLKTGPPAR